MVAAFLPQPPPLLWFQTSLRREARGVRPVLCPNLRPGRTGTRPPASQNSVGGFASDPRIQGNGKTTRRSRAPKTGVGRTQGPRRVAGAAPRGVLSRASLPSAGPFPAPRKVFRLRTPRGRTPASLKSCWHCGARAGNQDLFNVAARGAGRDSVLFS